MRVAWADDAEAIARVQAASWRTSYDGLLPAEDLAGLDVGAMARTWRSSLVSPPDARNRVLVALDRARLTGYAVVGPAGDPDLDPIADGELVELAVDPADRGQGHGSRLQQAVADTLLADGFTRALTWVGASDDALRAFLAGSGWAPDGAHRELDLYGDGRVTRREVRLHTALS